jgi:hypothetical protein
METKHKHVLLDSETRNYIFECPHCELLVEVPQDQVNCHIFRHGYFYTKVNNHIILTNQMNPHTSKEECDRLKKENRIIGCGNPFRLTQKEGQYIVEVCGYI